MEKLNQIPLSYGKYKIRPPSSMNTPIKTPMVMAISMIASWVDGGFGYGFL
jgi:hypothetical protein